MTDDTWLATRFEAHRPRMHRLAYRMLGSPAEADDAVQDAWLRLHRSGADEIDNLGGWLTTVVSRICLNTLRSRAREEPLDWHLPDPVITADPPPDEVATLADSVGLALLVVLDTLSPNERLAFVLHDLFEVPYDDVAAVLDRSPEAARQLASRARRKVRGGAISNPDPTRRRAVVSAFFTAAREGDFETLLTLLHPEVVLRTDAGDSADSVVVIGDTTIASRAMRFAQPKARLVPVCLSGKTGVIVMVDGHPVVLMAFTVEDERITRIDAIKDADRIGRLDFSHVDVH